MTRLPGIFKGLPSLWLPWQPTRWTWVATAFVALVYAFTMSRDLSFFDSAELAFVAAQGGLGHPIGQPMHTILGWLFAHLPGVPVLVGLNLLSALPTALIVVPMVSLAEALAGKAEAEAVVPRWLNPAWLIPALAAGVVLHPVFWENGSRVEVYALTTLFTLWAVARVAAALSADEGINRGWLAAGVALGLAASTNAYIALIAGVALAPAVVVAVLRRRLAIASCLRAVLGGVLGLIPYAYVPLVAGRQDVFIWGLPVNGDALSRYFSGADYGHNREVTWGLIGEHLLQWFGWVAESGLLPIALLGVAAHLAWGHRAGLGRGCVLLSLLTTALLLASNAIFWPHVPDYAGYVAGPAALAGAGTVAIVIRLTRGPALRQKLAALLALALFVSVLASPPALHARTRHADRVARVLAEGVLTSAPRDAIVVVSSDHWLFPLMYLQEIEAQRPDVTVLASGLAGSSWYWPQVYRRHADLEPIVLRAPGGTPARIRRFLHANESRPVLYEDWAMAMAYGRPGCLGAWLVMDQRFCSDPNGASTDDALTPAMARALDSLGRGSPTTDAVIANVTYDRGEALWRLGRPVAAFSALEAGVPPDLRPPRPSATTIANAGTLTAAPLRWPDTPLVGDAYQNLLLASRLLLGAGARDDALRYYRAAVAAGYAPPAP